MRLDLVESFPHKCIIKNRNHELKTLDFEGEILPFVEQSFNDETMNRLSLLSIHNSLPLTPLSVPRQPLDNSASKSQIIATANANH